MQNKLILAAFALCCSSIAFSQEADTVSVEAGGMTDESAFTFSEAQLGESDDMAANVTILNSNSNIYAREVGFLFSPVRFRYRAFNQKFNEVFINGAPMNDLESGQFRYSMIGGLNQQTRNRDFALPFEEATFAHAAMAGSNNYNFRAGSMGAGHRLALTATNRNYTLRGMYTYASGFNEKGWAFAGNLTYRWANRGYAEGTFYNALSYFLGVQKKWLGGHSLAISTWGNPTERASQGAATDESYWIANNRFYNPYWGYQNGKVRNSRVVNDFAPSAIATWDWEINRNTKLTTSLFGKYSIYKNTKLNYNNSDNPQPDYWKNLPSSYYDVWDKNDANNRTEELYEDYWRTYEYLTAAKENRQINWERLYWANKQANASGADAMYYIQARHNNNLTLSLSSTLNMNISRNTKWNAGINLATNTGRHYQTLDDLLGANSFRNVNTYAIGTYSPESDAVQYDLNNRDAQVRKGDKYGYDYTLLVRKAYIWSNIATNQGRWHLMLSAKTGGTTMQRDGKMRNGLFADNSYGKSGVAKFGELAGKAAATLDMGKAGVVRVGMGYEWRAPQATTAFVSPEMNNNFVNNLKNERVFSTELTYQFQNPWLQANVSGYYSHLDNVTEWQNFYFDDINSFSYVSMTGIKKAYYGVEAGLRFKINNNFNITAVGTISEAKNLNNATVRYLSSTKATYNDANNGKDEVVYNKDMRESGTPLTALSIGVNYSRHGWFASLKANYYDRIYLSYSPSYRYESTLKARYKAGDQIYDIIDLVQTTDISKKALEQAKGHGGVMVDGSIGKSFRINRGKSIMVNIMVNNLLNNRNIVTGGYEQSRSDYTASGNVRAYKFSKNPKKYYAMGINGMINVSYRF